MVAIASLPFAPEIVVPTVRNFARMNLGMTRLYGFKPSFNQSYAMDDSPTGWWVTPWHFGIDQGPGGLIGFPDYVFCVFHFYQVQTFSLL